MRRRETAPDLSERQRQMVKLIAQGCSAREQEVCELLAQGRTNQEIATMLFISLSTAKVHVKHILEKLGVRSRVEAARLWEEKAS